ncbi:protein FAR1-RELATED SEQUENCE 5-like [Neltuma alba]|uniref:protein FAR1-RELATED SEQUENCE 5-like n=1 Tax=Neltuma alba TaxID=207710 RepID=UPI0010A3F03E|nr:protein FAR1-RELATED SEQUENCE 5-like [Prosopis alba]
MAEMKEGEAYTLLHYFESKQYENPSFFYEIQLDVENQITNIFWADAKMVVDYFYFGDMVSFDTTYRTNRHLRPFAPFVGFNHHRQTVTFGAALLYDETSESFEWLFRTFMKAMCGKKPTTIFTDQDPAMAKAIAKVFPESYHRLCAWHLSQNACKHINHVYKKSDSFASDFKGCICDFEYEDDFLNAWESMLDKYDLRQNKWLQDLFEKREKWASVYGRHAFCAGATITQLSESFNGRLRGYMKPTLNVLGFFRNFERLIEDMRYKELEENYEMSQAMPPLNLDVLLLKNARESYTRAIFLRVKKEYEKSCNILFKECNQVSKIFEYKVCVMGDMGDHKVTFNSEDETVECSCKKYEFVGILCCHALRVLNLWNKLVIPSRYILKRWSKHARSGCVIDNSGRIIKEDPKLDVSNRFKDLCRIAVDISSKAAESDDATNFLAKKFVELVVEVEKILGKSSSIANQQNVSETIATSEKDAFQAKGLKKKEGVSRVKGRPKSCLEKKSKRKRHQEKPSSTLH